MRLVSCTIWILAILLVVGSLDNRPDPPAADPSGAALRILQTHDCCDVLVRQYFAPPPADPRLLSFAVAETAEPFRPSDRVVMTRQAADPSPPRLQSGRTFASIS